MAVGEGVGNGKRLHAGGPGLLDDAHVGDVVGDQRIEADLQLAGITGDIMRLQNAVGHGFPLPLLRGDRGAGAGNAGAQEHAFIVDCDHRFDLLDADFAVGNHLPPIIPYQIRFGKIFCRKR